MIDPEKVIRDALRDSCLDWEALHQLQTAVSLAARDMRRRAVELYQMGGGPRVTDFPSEEQYQESLKGHVDRGEWLEAMILGAALLDMERRRAQIRLMTMSEPFLDPPIGFTLPPEPKETAHDQWRRKLLNGEYLSPDE